MNSYSKELCHWAFGEKKKNHKYIDRIRDTLRDTWKYIYEDKKNAAAKNRQVVKNFADNWRDGADVIKNKVKSTFGRSGKSTINMAREKYGLYTVYDPKTKTAETYEDREEYDKAQKEKRLQELKNEAERKKQRKQQVKDKIDETVNDAKKLVNTVLRAIGINYQLPIKQKKIVWNFVRNYNDVNVSDVAKTPARPVVGKDTMEDGRLVIFHDENQMKEWNRIKKYQQDEPEFMKKVKNIEPDKDGVLPSLDENQAKVNPEHEKNSNASVNCYHCSIAYDLRKRGYDVSALPIESEYSTSQLNKFYDIQLLDAKGDPVSDRYRTNAEVNPINDKELEVQSGIAAYCQSVGQTDVAKLLRNASGRKVVQLWDSYTTSDGNVAFINPTREIAKFVDNNNTVKIMDCLNDDQFGDIMAKSVSKKMDKFPSGSWGRIDVSWDPNPLRGGGGHTFQWEKDEHGNTIFIDCQTNQEVSLKDYMSCVSRSDSVVVVRTDSLALKEQTTRYVKDNNGETNPTKKEAKR